MECGANVERITVTEICEVSCPYVTTDHWTIYCWICLRSNHKRNLADNTRGGGGGGKTVRGDLGLYLTKESNLKEGKISPVKLKFFIFFFLSIFYLPLFNSVTKKFPGWKNIGGIGPPPLPPPPLKLRLWL
jgi:hypothetical protein